MDLLEFLGAFHFTHASLGLTVLTKYLRQTSWALSRHGKTNWKYFWRLPPASLPNSTNASKYTQGLFQLCVWEENVKLTKVNSTDPFFKKQLLPDGRHSGRTYYVVPVYNLKHFPYCSNVSSVRFPGDRKWIHFNWGRFHFKSCLRERQGVDMAQALGVLKGHTDSLREYPFTRQQRNPSGLKWSPAWLGTVTFIIPFVDKIPN